MKKQQNGIEKTKVNLEYYSDEILIDMIMDVVDGYAKDFEVVSRLNNVVTLSAVGDIMDDHVGKRLLYQVDGDAAYIDDEQVLVDIMYRTIHGEAAIAQTVHFR